MSLRCWMGVALVMVKGRRGAVKGQGTTRAAGQLGSRSLQSRGFMSAQTARDYG